MTRRTIVTGIFVTRSEVLDAPIEDVWAALTDPAALSQWLADAADLDLRPGGVGRIRLPDGDRSVLVTARDEGRRLSMLWWREGDGQLSAVDLTISPSPSTGADPRTELVVVERLVIAPAEAHAARVSMGMRWGCAFALLSTVCAVGVVGAVR
jgi:uncharacterized protein YndB with AHSA1/START domain